jgi:acyl-CoA dehydrogenase
MTTIGTTLAGGVFTPDTDDDDFADLRRLIDGIGRKSFDAGIGQRRRPEKLDGVLWQDAGPADLAVLLYGLARHCAAVPIVETDLLAAWLAHQGGLSVPADGPLTIAIADGDLHEHRLHAIAHGVPWTRAAHAVVLAARASEALYVGLVDASELTIEEGLNLAGEPRDRIRVDLRTDGLHRLDAAIGDELLRRGAWARCVQIIGALDAAALSTVTHCRQRVQFGKPLSNFQAVQQSLAVMAGDIERARAVTALAVAAAADHGFGSKQTDYAVTLAKVVCGQVVSAVATTAHQLHGAIGVSIEHPLWLSTLRAQSWIDEFGSTRHHAARLGDLALRTVTPWDCITGQI